MKTLRDLPQGSLVRLGSIYNKPIIWRVLEHDHPGYPAGSTTLLTDRIITFEAFDAAEPDNEDTNRATLGNNNWYEACLRTWLNSADKSWYFPTHSADSPPEKPFVSANDYADKPGFLGGFSEKEKSILLKTILPYGSYEKNDHYSVDKVFLLSANEVSFGASGNDGVSFGCLLTYADRIAYATEDAIVQQKEAYWEIDKPVWWWLRSSFRHNSYIVQNIFTDGSFDATSADSGFCGVRPACNSASSTYVTDTPDAHGVYNLIFGGESCAL